MLGRPVSVAALMLHSDPQLVHFCEVDQKEVNCIRDVTPCALIL